MTDTKVRKWLLSISAFLRNQNRGVVDAIELWKKNVDKASVGRGVEAGCRKCGEARG